MDGVAIEFLLGLYFVVATAPGLLGKPVSAATILQFGLGVILTVLAIAHISLLTLR